MILAKPNHIKIYGHRGARGDLPENTLDSFKYLFENNINAYETDILISKDLIPVITHDFRLDPSLTKDEKGNWITDENIKIFDLTYNEILKYDVGSLNKLSRYGRRFLNQKTLENQKIPKLSELLELSSKNISENLLINLEIKSTPDEENLTPVPEDTVKLVIKEVNKSNHHFTPKTFAKGTIMYSVSSAYSSSNGLSGTSLWDSLNPIEGTDLIPSIQINYDFIKPIKV